MAFRPNVPCVVITPGAYDQYGHQAEGARRNARCGIVKLDIDNMRTPIRTDASASRSSARETEAKVVLLIPSNVAIANDYFVEIQGFTFRVIRIFKRYGVDGRFDHTEIECDVWLDTVNGS